MASNNKNLVHYLNLTLLLNMQHMLATERSRAIIVFNLAEETALWLEQLAIEDIPHIACVDYFICDFNHSWKTLQVQAKLPPDSLGQKVYALLKGKGTAKKAKDE
ncbi:MAG: flagellar transcriptional regulator FlhD [Proteobacteria bacterium]|nr:flagellar transcriptional regulator FlhD [Pseudomonadota bacterium]